MPLADIQERYRELGRIRMGARRNPDNPNSPPMKLDHWRLTCSDRRLLDAAAGFYGGEVREWKNGPTEGDHFELFTKTDSLDIVVPPGYLLSQWYEFWAGGACKRRCDSITQRDTLKDCQCPKEHKERMTAAQRGEACTPVTRLSVMLPAVPDLGVWRLETHGYYAAIELNRSYETLLEATERGSYVRAQLRIDKRSARRPKLDNPEQFETRRFHVPVIAFEGTIAEIAQQLGSGGPGTALPNVTPPVLEANARALPTGRPGLTSDDPEAHTGIEKPDLPPPPAPVADTPAEPEQPLPLPKWLLEIDADDGTIIDTANAILAEWGKDFAVDDLTQLAGSSPEFQRELLERIAASTEATDATQGTLA